MPAVDGQILSLNEEGFFSYLKKHTNILYELGKVRITFFVAMSTSVGYLLYSGKIVWEMFAVSLGVFLLACSSSSINHYQERVTDAIMKRTKSRPIPSGRIEPVYAIYAAVLFLLTGSLILLITSNITAVLIGWITLFWYNAIYTPLKKYSALAVIPGSLIGALPPVIGYAAAGGSPFDMKIISLALFFFIWQIPHFWLLLMMLGSDYENAGFPTLTQKFNNGQLGRITFIWISTLAVSSMLLPLSDVSNNIYSLVGLIILGIWLLSVTAKIANNGTESKNRYRTAFLNINLYVLVVVAIVSLDNLFH